jgi:transcriptional activator protein UGA3
MSRQSGNSVLNMAPAPTSFLQSDSEELASRSLDRRLALRYYIQAFNAMLTTNLENNGFLTVLLPMAFEDKTLLDMLVAWSSSHLSLCDETYRVKALEHRSTALRSFTTSLPNSQESPEVSLACCLVFCSMSAILGDTAGWHNHLLGAAQIIRQASLEKLSRTYEGRWLLRNFAYHDVLMSVTLSREPIIPGRYWIRPSNMEIDSYVGLACEPLALISETSSLNSDMAWKHDPRLTSTIDGDVTSTSPPNDDRVKIPLPPSEDFLSRAHAIESELRTWTCPASDDFPLISLAEAYRSAALIHLHRIMRHRIPGTATEAERKIRTQVASVIRHIGQMPLNCLPECTSLFPLFMAGGEATTKADMQFVRERLQHIITHRHFQNAASALSVLEELWLQHTSFMEIPGGPLDWKDILQRRNWSLALS